jgi:hypothetical protein
VVWVSGAVSTLVVHPPLLRQSDRQNYDHFVERLLALGAAGYSDREIAQRLTVEGFRAARSACVPAGLIAGATQPLVPAPKLAKPPVNPGG